jgi:hypothetical protein
MSVKDDLGRSYEVTVAPAGLNDDLRLECEFLFPQDISSGQFCFSLIAMLVANRQFDDGTKAGIDLDTKSIVLTATIQSASAFTLKPQLVRTRMTGFFELVTFVLNTVDEIVNQEVTSGMVDRLVRKTTT